MRKWTFFFIFLIFPWIVEGKLPELTPKKVNEKVSEMMKGHASHKELTPEIMERAFINFVNELDPLKSYLIESDIEIWIQPDQRYLQQTLANFYQGDFQPFYEMYDQMILAIDRRQVIEEQIEGAEFPKRVRPEEFKDMQWVRSEDELYNRLLRIKGLQRETASKLKEEIREKMFRRIAKHQKKYEEDLKVEEERREKQVMARVLKAIASALDTHTYYFTPDEAAEFLISVQQRLFGIGAALRDDLNGFTVVKVVPGGPAAKGKELKAKDRIVAVNGEPVVGLDIIDAVELIRGEEGTTVILSVIREKEGDDEEELEISIERGEVVFTETRFDSSYEPFGDGVIAYLKLSSFYQDPQNSSARDLKKELNKYRENHRVKGVVLDLRYNTGGLLSQAVEVAGLFITKGIVVSIKDNSGRVQHLRDIDSNMTWGGPLIVLVNRASASASEIVAQTLQDYGRALVVGDDHTYGKGSFQTFTLNPSNQQGVNPEGEYKVTRGRYYTVSGRSPQLEGVVSDLIIPGSLSESEIGEKYAKYPLEGDRIKENFDDDLSDIPLWQRGRVKVLYKFDLQPKLTMYTKYINLLRNNSEVRITNNTNYQNFMKELKKDDPYQEEEQYGRNDLQLRESLNVMKDLIFLHELDHGR